MAHDHGEFREELAGEHPNSYDHNEPKYSLLWILGGTTVVLLILIGIGIQQYYNLSEVSTVFDRVLSQDSWQLQNLRNKENQELTHYGYADGEKKVIRIPIDQAMKLVVEDAAAGRMRYSTAPYAVKVETTAPAVSQPGAAAAAGAQQSGVTSSPNVQPAPASAAPAH